MSRPNRDLDGWLHAPVEPLPPPADAWPEIRRRAARIRTTRRAAAVVAAAAAVTAVVLPVALVVGGTGAGSHHVRAAGTSRPQPVTRHPSSGWPTPDSTTYSSWKPPSSLRDLAPRSVTFVTQTDGYLLGTVSGQVRLARTLDGGDSWAQLPVPSGYGLGSGPGAVGGVRFATTSTGFLFGHTYWSTTDSGESWKRLPSPGPITDLEVARNGRIWALVQQCRAPAATSAATNSCNTERLYTGTVADPRLAPELDVTTLPDRTAQLSITATGSGIFVLANRADGEPVRYWSTDAGHTWQGDTGPCVHEGAVAALATDEVALLCADPARRGDRARALVVVDHLGRRTPKQRVDVAAPPVGRLTGLTANLGGGAVLADGFSGRHPGAPFQVTTDAGRSWQPCGPRLKNGAGFVGFISPVRVVALSAPADHAFLASDDGGLSWRVTAFAH